MAWLREQNRAAALRFVERRAFPLADRVLCVSEADAVAVRAAGGRAMLAPNGVDDEFFLVPPATSAIACCSSGISATRQTCAGSSGSLPRVADVTVPARSRVSRSSAAV